MPQQLTVLQSFPTPRATSVNPYTLLLAENLRAVPGVTVLNFDWRTALLARYDVFHVHWPEILVDGNGPLKALVRQALTLLLLTKLRVTRTPVVRTVHNIDLPTGLSRRQRMLLRLADKQTALRIRLNSTTPIPAGTASALIPHGHYRDWFAKFPVAATVAGQMGYVGRIRGYKGLDALITAFRGTGDADAATAGALTLHIGGYPSSAQLAEEVTRLAGDDDRITLQFGFITDAQLVEIVTSSELVVLPYPAMHNSGATLAALSLSRPVLVPDNAVNRMLGEEVGAGWVHRFTGTLTAEALLAAIVAVHAQRPVGERIAADRSGAAAGASAAVADADAARGGRPNLDARGWDDAAVAHVAAYRAAIAVARPGTRKDG